MLDEILLMISSLPRNSNMHAGSLGERIYVGQPMADGVDNVQHSVADKVREVDGRNVTFSPGPRRAASP